MRIAGHLSQDFAGSKVITAAQVDRSVITFIYSRAPIQDQFDQRVSLPLLHTAIVAKLGRSP